MTLKWGDRVRFESLVGTVGRRILGPGPLAFEVRWDNGCVGTVWASDLQREGDDHE